MTVCSLSVGLLLMVFVSLTTGVIPGACLIES